ncbi:hypothetical protein ACR6L3_001842 [Enterococcus faecalis]|nr:hypothetical protein [Enterococcus faecalis]
MELITKGYHCGITKSVENFCSDYNQLLISEHINDKKWAGVGMYLWDNRGNANWWYRTRHNKENRSICSCKIIVDEDKLIDFTDEDQVKRMNRFLVMMRTQRDVFDILEKDVGDKIDFLAKNLQAEVIKLMGDYSFKESHEFFSVDPKGASPGIPGKIMYCVKPGNSHVLKDRRMEEIES